MKVYDKMLEMISQRRVQVTNEIERVQRAHESEREFMDAWQLILESGYSLLEQDFYDLLSMLCVTDKIMSV